MSSSLKAAVRTALLAGALAVVLYVMKLPPPPPPPLPPPREVKRKDDSSEEGDLRLEEEEVCAERPNNARREISGGGGGGVTSTVSAKALEAPPGPTTGLAPAPTIGEEEAAQSAPFSEKEGGSSDGTDRPPRDKGGDVSSSLPLPASDAAGAVLPGREGGDGDEVLRQSALAEKEKSDASAVAGADSTRESIEGGYASSPSMKAAEADLPLLSEKEGPSEGGSRGDSGVRPPVPVASFRRGLPSAKRKSYTASIASLSQPEVLRHTTVEDLIPPVDTTNYSVLKSYWSQQSSRNVFKAPIRSEVRPDLPGGDSSGAGRSVVVDEKASAEEERRTVPLGSDRSDDGRSDEDPGLISAGADEEGDDEAGESDDDAHDVDEGYVKIIHRGSGNPMTESELGASPLTFRDAAHGDIMTESELLIRPVAAEIEEASFSKLGVEGDEPNERSATSTIDAAEGVVSTPHPPAPSGEGIPTEDAEKEKAVDREPFPSP